MAARQYSEEVALLKHISKDQVVALAEFICKSAGLIELGTNIETSDGSINDPTLAGALAALEPHDEMRGISVNISESPAIESDFWVILWWFVTLEGEESLSSIQVTGPDRIKVFGVAAATRQFIARTMPAPSDPVPSALTVRDEDDILPTNIDRLIVTAATSDHVEQPLSARRYALTSGRAVAGGNSSSAGWWRRKRDEVSVEVLGTVIGGTILAIGGAVWAVFVR